MLVLVWMAAHLAYGVALVMVLVPARTVGPRFYRLNLGIAAVLLAVALLVDRFSANPLKVTHAVTPLGQPLWATGVCFLLCVAATLLSVLIFQRLWFLVLVWLAAVAAAWGILAEALALSQDASRIALGAGSYILGLFSSALLLGMVLVSMNLGHWYLVVLDMPFRYLRNFSFLFAGAVLLKSIALGVTLYCFGRQFPEAIASTTTNFLSGNALFFWTRVTVGVVLPMILAVMIWLTVRIRSNQSATGLLYVAVIFVLFGELFAKYLLAVSRLPL